MSQDLSRLTDVGQLTAPALCGFCGDPIEAEGFRLMGPTGAVICLDCLNAILDVVRMLQHTPVRYN